MPPRSQPMNRGKGLARSTKPMRKVSAKKARQVAAFANVRAEVFERDGYRCQTNRIASELTTVMPDDWPVCSWWRIDPHHRQRQGHGGEDTPRNVDTTCRAHHDWIHAHPALATELGLPVRPVQVALAALWTKGLAERDGRGVYVPANTTCGYCAGPVGEHLHVLDDRPLCGACYSRVAIPTEARSAS